MPGNIFFSPISATRFALKHPGVSESNDKHQDDTRGFTARMHTLNVMATTVQLSSWSGPDKELQVQILPCDRG